MTKEEKDVVHMVSMLDSAVGNDSIKHREVQSHESHRFLSLFKGKGIEYLDKEGKSLHSQEYHNHSTFFIC